MTDSERTERARERLREAEAEGVKRAQANGHDAAPAGVLLWHQITGNSSTDRLVKRLMGSASLVVIAGPTGSGKTFIALDCCVHVALNRPWFGRKVTRVGVLYVGAEGQAGLIKRISAIKAHYGIAEDAVPFALYPAPIDLVTDASGVKQIISYVEALNKILPVPIGIVVIDTLARCFGSGDESATQDMNTFVSRCDTIRTKTGATVLVVHHFGKDESKGMRGSIALKAAADTVIEVTGLEGIRTARVEKQKDGAAGESFAFLLKPIDLGLDDEGEMQASCVVVPSDAPAHETGKGKRPMSAECLTALDYLKDIIADHGQIIAMNGMPANVRAVNLDVWRDYLKQRGLHEGGDAGKKWFQRTRGKLISEKRIAVNHPFVWTCP